MVSLSLPPLPAPLLLAAPVLFARITRWIEDGRALARTTARCNRWPNPNNFKSLFDVRGWRARCSSIGLSDRTVAYCSCWPRPSISDIPDRGKSLMAMFDVCVCAPSMGYRSQPPVLEPFVVHQQSRIRTRQDGDEDLGRKYSLRRVFTCYFPTAAPKPCIFRQFLKACLSAPEAGGGCTNPHWVCLHSDLMSDASPLLLN